MHTSPNAFTLPEAHVYFAGECLETAATLLQTPSRSHKQNEDLEVVAQAAYYHTLQTHEKNRFVRSLWMLAKVYAALKNAAKSVYYATKCREVSGDFEGGNALEFAYACEALGRAYDASENPDEAHGYLQLALDLADELGNSEAGKQFLSDYDLPCGYSDAADN